MSEYGWPSRRGRAKDRTLFGGVPVEAETQLHCNWHRLSCPASDHQWSFQGGSLFVRDWKGLVLRQSVQPLCSQRSVSRRIAV